MIYIEIYIVLYRRFTGDKLCDLMHMEIGKKNQQSVIKT